MKYRVFLTEEVDYTIEVEADDEEHAEEVAQDLWVLSENPTADFDGTGSGVEVYAVETIGGFSGEPE